MMSKFNTAEMWAIWEADRGQKQIPGYVLHHCDGDRLNDDPENLQCLTKAFHDSLHARLRKGKVHTAESRSNMSAAHVGAKHSLETRARMRESSKRLWASPEARAKMGIGQSGKPLSEEHRAKIGAAQVGKKRTNETRAKISASQKRYWANKRKEEK